MQGITRQLIVRESVQAVARRLLCAYARSVVAREKSTATTSATNTKGDPTMSTTTAAKTTTETTAFAAGILADMSASDRAEMARWAAELGGVGPVVDQATDYNRAWGFALLRVERAARPAVFAAMLAAGVDLHAVEAEAEAASARRAEFDDAAATRAAARAAARAEDAKASAAASAAALAAAAPVLERHAGRLRGVMGAYGLSQDVTDELRLAGLDDGAICTVAESVGAYRPEVADDETFGRGYSKRDD